MLRPNRPAPALQCALPPALLLVVACSAPRPDALPSWETDLAPVATPEDPHQIHWERSLDDALAIAKAEGRPLLIAMNMDGESASDRIVHEEYRDPRFVAATRSYVCLVASLFRHNAQDYDADGNRIPCPRLGCCTCGEHIALEPILFERFLGDGERVAPRHAAILPDGTKPWDLSLSFDLQDIDKAVLATAATAPPAAGTTDPHRARARTAIEAGVARSAADFTPARIDELADRGDRGTLDALRLLIVHLPTMSADARARFAAATTRLGIAAEMGTALRERIQTLVSPASDEVWLDMLATIDARTPATRAFLLACRAAGYPGSDAALAQAFGADEAERCEQALALIGGPFRMADHLAAAAATREAAGDAAPPIRPTGDEMPAAAELVRTLEALDKQLAEHRDDAAMRRRYAKASMDLARRHIETNERDVQTLLEDAEANFAKALAAHPDDATVWIERARCAYFRSQFEEETIFGREALRAAFGTDTTAGLDPARPVTDLHALEALRWIADGCMRRFGALLADQPAAALAAMAEAMRAAGMVATGAQGGDADWTSFASGFGALGLWREQFAAAQAGALRAPDGRGIRQCLDQALWAGGAADLCHSTADAIATAIGDGHRAFADASWFAGYGWLLRAEQERRKRNDGAAAVFYAGARERFAAAARANADYAESCAHYAALCWVGEGLAAVQHGDRIGGADALVQAVTAHRQLAGAVDGLGYDVLDLVDKIFEWRADGPSPVDPLRVLERIDAVAPDDPFWVTALADIQLREALRADGRNPERAMQETVDAGGNAIRMMLGLPNAEGDTYLLRSLALLRRKAELLVSDDDRKALAQSATIWAERNLARGRSDGVRDALAEAAELLDRPEVEENADPATLRAVAKDLRALLGEARPRWRNGR